MTRPHRSRNLCCGAGGARAYRIALALLLLGAAALTSVSQAAAVREDAIWARNAGADIVLDGQLDEADWDAAESIVLRFWLDSGVPGSGWKGEAGMNPIDPTFATLKFLVRDNTLYLGAVMNDASVGGSREFNRFDGLLISVKDHLSAGAPKPPAEYFYAWWYPETEDPQPAGQDPAFIGRWAEWPPGTPRTPEQIEAWDAVTVVDGLSNNDSVLDETYTVEMKFDLTPMGYDLTDPDGDIVEWNISIYDSDWFWPFQGSIFSANRVWLQSPWGNAAWYSEMRIHVRPDVTTSSGPAPEIGPEYVVENGAAFATPVIDGVLDEAAWASVDGFDIRFGDDALRQTYPAVGPYRAGQFQPEVNGGQAFVIDPGDATVKMFHKGDYLYLGFDVRDLVVQYHPNFDRWDGFLVSLNDREERGPDNNLLGRRLTFNVGEDGEAIPGDFLLTLVQEGGAEVAINLNPGTVVDTLGLEADNGYTAELAVDLTQLGYPSGLGDGVLFLGITLLDGDSFVPSTDSYGTRTWWFREYENDCCPVWAQMELSPTSVEDQPSLSESVGLARNFPNPATQTTISYRLPGPRAVSLEVYDVTGRLVAQRDLGVQEAGIQEVPFDGSGLAAGLYPYRLLLGDPSGGGGRTSLEGRMIILR